MQSGMSTWHQDQNPLGTVVELHGNARFLLCPHCHQVFEVKNADLIHMKRCRPKMCSVCHRGHLRFKIMLYDDEEASLITPEDVWTRLEDDLQVADLVVWVGISFEQVCPFPVLRLACCDACACLADVPCGSHYLLASDAYLQHALLCLQSASTEYFRKARTFLMDHGRLESVAPVHCEP